MNTLPMMAKMMDKAKKSKTKFQKKHDKNCRVFVCYHVFYFTVLIFVLDAESFVI